MERAIPSAPVGVKALPTNQRVVHEVACCTEMGRSHHKNQDTGGAWTWQREDGVPVSLLVVADGVSAGPRSELASRAVTDAIRGAIEPRLHEPETSIEEILVALVDVTLAASDDIAQSTAMSSPSDATTLVAAICVGRETVGAWCGDSRIYRFSEAGVGRLTRDHSWAEEVVSNGLMSAGQAAADPRAHMITRWLGAQESGGPQVDTFAVQLEVGDVLLCCSDGVYMYFDRPDGEDAEIAAVLRDEHRPLPVRLRDLIDLACDRGGQDDLTGACLSIKPG